MRDVVSSTVSLGSESRLQAAADTIERGWPRDGSQVQTLVEDLRRSDERTRFALGVARTGVWEAELFTGQVEWSDTMHLAMGRPAASFDGTIEGMRALIHPDDRDRFTRVIHGNFEQPRDFHIDVRVPWSDGSCHWVQFRGQIGADAGGMSVRLVSVAQDVTDQKQLELKLRQSQKMEAMGHLAGGVAHDFNNILTAILGYAALIELDDVEPELTHDHAIQIRKAAERAAALTKQLLAFSRRQVIDRRALYLPEIIDDLLPMLDKILGERVHIVREFEEGVAPVLADTGQLQQVVLNLAINARDAMPAGGQLTVQVGNVTLTEVDRVPRFRLAKGAYVVLTVTDTGSGMDSSTREHIFEPFFTTKGEGEGTGLGLSTVFEIVKALGGGIRVSSEPGCGTTFRIYLPRTAEETLVAGVPATARLIGDGETVLVVEDEATVLLLITDILGRNGYTVLTAADSDHARAIALDSSRKIDLIVSDVMMPDGTGPELVQSLGTGACRPRALFMSGYAGAALTRQGRIAADSQFLQKPFTGPQLLSKVREVLDSAA
jgi:two-component system, cell cycle sensor histidine kinase and response regulator CckA